VTTRLLPAAESARLAAEREAAEQTERERLATIAREEEARQATLRAEQEARDRAEQERLDRIAEGDRLRREQQQREQDELDRQRRELAQERAFNDLRASLEAVQRTAMASVDLDSIFLLGAGVDEEIITSDTYGKWEVEAEQLRNATATAISERYQEIFRQQAPPTLPLSAAAELTASPSPEGVEAAAAAAREYPGDQAMVDCIAVHMNVPEEAARQWLLIYTESTLPDAPVAP
jgi:hypothetical protein